MTGVMIKNNEAAGNRKEPVLEWSREGLSDNIYRLLWVRSWLAKSEGDSKAKLHMVYKGLT